MYVANGVHIDIHHIAAYYHVHEGSAGVIICIVFKFVNILQIVVCSKHQFYTINIYLYTLQFQ